MRQYVAFDIEIVKPIPDGADDWKTFRPLGISCAATLPSDKEPKLWYGQTPGGEISDKMSQIELIKLVEYLEEAVRSGKTVLTWNGLGFDFDILAEESGMRTACQEMALDQVDMMFQIFCLRGYPLGLDKAAKGMGLPGKPAGMRGDLAPKYWAEGRRREVLEYVVQDVRTTLALAQAVVGERGLRWRSNRGRPQFLPLPEGWLTVRDALRLPEPDTSWMKKPWKRQKFAGWLSQPS